VATLLALPIFLIFALFARPVVTLVFGAAYAGAAAPLAILASGQLVNATAGPVAALLSMTGHERDVGAVFTMAAIINVLLNIFLIPRFGINGAAAATAVSLAFWNIALFVRVRSRLGISSTAFLVSARK
jgi:O-antigen/teichoic acid export membrane protein